jgi:hypothetical protein
MKKIKTIEKTAAGSCDKLTTLIFLELLKYNPMSPKRGNLGQFFLYNNYTSILIKSFGENKSIIDLGSLFKGTGGFYITHRDYYTTAIPISARYQKKQV